MKKLRSSLYMLTLGLNSLLVFLWLLEDRVVLPSWLQVIGRLHPLLLHLPISFLLINLLLLWIPEHKKKEIVSNEIAALFLLLTAFTASLTALMGLFLSRENSYDPESLNLHKWTGLLVAFTSFGWYLQRKWLTAERKPQLIIGIPVLVILLITGHEGASITHGQGYVLEPILQKEKKQVALEDAQIFEHVIKPIFEAKCISCHSSKKAKGELILETVALLKKGGKSGKLWETGSIETSLLMKRLHLPAEDKKHMPPPGKTPLDDEELNLLTQWLKSGSPLDGKLLDLAATDSFRIRAAALFSTSSAPTFEFKAASEKDIEALNNSNRLVIQTDKESPALVVKFYNSAFYTTKALEELKTVAEQIVELDLARMPIKEDDLSIIAGFPNLMKLNLNFTGIKGEKLNALTTLKNLKTVSLSGTNVNLDRLKPLQAMQSLQQLVVWNTAITEDQLEKLRAIKGSLHYETGFRSDTMILQLSPPVFQNEETVIREAQPVKLKHYINGSVIRYTVDGTEPDSLTSPIYDGKLMVQKNMRVKARAFKKGWISSSSSEQFFFKSSYKPDSIIFIKPSDAKYSSTGPNALFDLVKGDFNFASGMWLAYKDNDMETILQFNKPPAISNITLSCMHIVGSYIMPAARAEVLGSNDRQTWKSLGVKIPEQPKEIIGAGFLSLDFNFPSASYKFYKLIMKPVSKLPQWHPGKGDKGWAFIDEIFIN